ncbi:MAG: molybdate ABC transporter substrate-binding protein [Clostridiales bacterium]|jgi:molybdate transport system substrate-binding protein|nr:molybdate ABC transporter substrate-binding protein [Clostridiales bacterium]
MRKFFSMLLVIAMLAGIAACSSNNAETLPAEIQGTAEAESPASAEPSSETAVAPTSDPEEKIELIVFAAASMTETLEQIALDYKDIAPSVTLIFNFDSSGTLKTQIQEGAECDFFISAGQKQMDQLDISADPAVNTENLDFVLDGSRQDLLENKVTLCVPEGNPGSILNFDDLAVKLENDDILLAMGNSDVPVGQYTQKILAYYNLDEESLANSGKITYGSNVKEVTSQISESSVTCGVVYCTDAFSASLEIVDYATAEMCGKIIYPAAILNISKNSEEAQKFMDYLKTDEAMAVFEKVGFTKA